MKIEHQDETQGNALRNAFNEIVGKGQDTFTPTRVVISKAKGVHLWTADGRRLIDFTSGVLVCNLGYNHKGFEKRVKAYSKGLPRNAYNMIAEIQVTASRRLRESIGLPQADRVLWAASGSEGIQKAMWACLARYPERNIMVATRAGFHGKKGLANDVTGEASANPDVRWLSFPLDASADPEQFRGELDALWHTHANKIALLITEPYLGARGSFHPPKWYHPLLQDWCRRHDIPFIFDEVQACFGRTGEMYAFQTYGVQPDMVVLGKGLANGEPASAVVGRGDLIDALGYGGASDTFSGNPRACAAVCATLDIMEEEGVVEQARKTGKRLGEVLARLQQQFPFITAVRGEGMVYGVEMVDGAIANRCVLEAYRASAETGVHFLGPLHGKVLRVSPPLVLKKKNLAEAEELLMQAWERV
ncbi:MAG: aspartate aminotransferase family protein [Candidatus Hydrogenedentes bacterium]|nr:aspartate aminotransferase family protein [Candidatus Hydrogenedentota bacterium]